MQPSKGCDRLVRPPASSSRSSIRSFTALNCSDAGRVRRVAGGIERLES